MQYHNLETVILYGERFFIGLFVLVETLFISNLIRYSIIHNTE